MRKPRLVFALVAAGVALCARPGGAQVPTLPPSAPAANPGPLVQTQAAPAPADLPPVEPTVSLTASSTVIINETNPAFAGIYFTLGSEALQRSQLHSRP